MSRSVTAFLVLVLLVMMLTVYTPCEGKRKNRNSRRGQQKQDPPNQASFWPNKQLKTLQKKIEQLKKEFKEDSWTMPAENPLKYINTCSDLLQPPEYCPGFKCTRDAISHMAGFLRPLASVRKNVNKPLEKKVKQVERALRKLLKAAKSQCEEEAKKENAQKRLCKFKATKKCSRKIEERLENAAAQQVKSEMLILLIETLHEHLEPKAKKDKTSSQKAETSPRSKEQVYDDLAVEQFCALRNKAKELKNAVKGHNQTSERYKKSCGALFKLRGKDFRQCTDYVTCYRYVYTRVGLLFDSLRLLYGKMEHGPHQLGSVVTRLNTTIGAVIDVMGALENKAKTFGVSVSDISDVKQGKLARAEEKCNDHYIERQATNADVKKEIAYSLSADLESFVKNLEKKKLKKLKDECRLY